MLGTLRQQLLYPVWTLGNGDAAAAHSNGDGSANGAKKESWWSLGRPSASDTSAGDASSKDAAAAGANGVAVAAAAASAIDAAPRPPLPTDAEIASVLSAVRLGHLLQRSGLDEEVRAHCPRAFSWRGARRCVGHC